MAAVWTRDDLIRWVDDDVVAFLDATAQPLPVPEWLVPRDSRARLARPHTAGQRLAAAHPDDRQRTVDLWWELMRRPGEPFELETVVKGPGGWSREGMRYLNLLEHEDVAAVVVAVRFLGEAAGVELPEVIQSGEFEEVDLLMHELDGTGLILRTEGKVYEITGRRPEDVIGQSVLDHLHPDGYDDAVRSWIEVMGGPPGTSRTGRQRVLRPDGSIIWVEATTIKREAEDGAPTATVIAHDLTERRKQESALRASQLEFRLLADQVPAAVFRADATRRLTFRNEQWARLLDDGLPIEHLDDIVHAGDRARFEKEMAVLVDGPEQRTTTCEVRSRDGSCVYAISCQSVLDLLNDTRSFVGCVTDITSTVRLREQAERDPLTELYNRRAVEDHLDRLLADEASGGVVVVFIDVDNFKDVNDTYGHEVGDLVLCTLGQRLERVVRADDVVARYGGDEFVMVVRHFDADGESIVERIECVLREPVTWNGGSWRPEASIGTARPHPGEDRATVLRRADHAMFENKRTRRQRLS